MLLSKNESINEQFKNISQDVLDIDIVSSLKEGISKDYQFIFINCSFFRFQKLNFNKDHIRSVLNHLSKTFPGAKIVVFANRELIKDLAMIVKVGASDFLTVPLVRNEILLATEDVREVTLNSNQAGYLSGQFWDSSFEVQMVTKSTLMEDVYTKVRQVAEKPTNVLLTGDTGVGKNIIAKLIHGHSFCKSKSFISVHCGAIPESLIESELFGHEKGSFTGAIKRKLGKFELANKGTIFLDEVGTLSMPAQIKLLRVLQDSNFQRVGGEEDVHVDIRVIAATNADLSSLVQKGKFREDLFYRLNVFPIKIPSLKERSEDIPHFLDYFSERYSQLYGGKIHGYSPEVSSAAKSYSWPGNIRELENLVERACIVEQSSRLEIGSFPIIDQNTRPVDKIENSQSLTVGRQEVIDNFEKEYLENLLIENNGKISTISEIAGLGVRQVHKLLAKYDLHGEAYRNKGHGQGR